MPRTKILAILTVVLLGTTLINAQATRTWVSGVGDDANPCSRTAPCKTFAGAISKTAPGGEIDALDPGGFGALTITKSITLDGGGGQVASVLVAGTNGIVVAAGPNDIVIIRNMRLDGLLGGGNANAGINGIRWISGKALFLENDTIFGFSNNGIDISKSDGGNLLISNTTVTNVGQAGIRADVTTNNVNVTIDGSRFEGNANGVWAGNSSRFTVRDTVASGNSGGGFVCQASSGTAVLDIANSMASNNANGIVVGGSTNTSTVRINAVSLFENSTNAYFVLSNGTIQSWQNNYNSGTGTPSSTLTPQ